MNWFIDSGFYILIWMPAWAYVTFYFITRVLWRKR